MANAVPPPTGDPPADAASPEGDSSSCTRQASQASAFPAAVAPLGVAVAATLVLAVAACLSLPDVLAPAWSAALLVVGAWCWRRRARARLLGVAMAGLGLCGLHADAALALRLPAAYERVDVALVGTVRELPTHEAQRTRFTFAVDDAVGIPPHLRGRLLRLAWYDDGYGRTRMPLHDAPAAPRRAVVAGGRWALRLRLRAPRGLRNPGTMDGERHAFAARIAATGYVRDVAEAREVGQPRGIDAWRERMATRIDAAIAGRGGSARYVRALALGDTRGLADEDWEVLRATGLTHLIAISGFHVGLVAGFFALCASLAWRLAPGLGRRVPRPQAAAIGALLGAAGYAAVAGFALPTVRTVLMIGVVVVARLWRRPVGVLEALALAAIAMLVVDPLALLAPGFWLSFAGVAWLAWCLPDARDGGVLRGFLSAQAVATLGLLPLTVALFGQASVAGPLANLLAIPWWSLVVVPLSLLGTGAEALHAGWGTWPWRLAAWCFDPSWRLFEALAASGAALWWLPEARWYALPLAVAGAFWCLLPRGVPGKPLALLLWLPLLWPDRRLPAHGEAEMVVIDVGQGLSVLVRTRRHALLYDMGPAIPDGFDAGERAVLPALHALGVRALDVAVVSHQDSDHAGGLPAVRRRFAPGVAYAPALSGVAGTHPCVAGHQWARDGVRFVFLHPPPHFPPLRNEASCVLRVETRHGAMLLTGDIGAVVEQGLARRQPHAVRAEVVVVAHHGSRHSSDTEFIAATAARHALVGAGHGNRFGHPDTGVLDRWSAAGARPWNTATGGALRVRMGRDGTRVEARRTTHPRLWDAARERD